MYRQNVRETANHDQSFYARKADRVRGWLKSLCNRAIVGAVVMAGLFLLYRAVWLTGWYWPYALLRDYLADRLPSAAPWVVQSLASLMTLVIFSQAAALVSYVLFGKHQRTVLALSLAGVMVNATLGWYSHGRVVVDDKGRVTVRIVERPDGRLKVIEHDFDPETGRPARWATEADLVMLDLQRRGLKVQHVGREGPFRSPQGTINVYYTRRDGRIALYTGPRHGQVTGDMPMATEEVVKEFLRQK